MLSHFDAIVEAAERDRQTVGFGRPSSIALSLGLGGGAQAPKGRRSPLKLER